MNINDFISDLMDIGLLYIVMLLMLKHLMPGEIGQMHLIHRLHDFAHKQDSQLNSLVLITVWRVAIEV